MLNQGRKRFIEKRSDKMWEILFGYGIEKIFGSKTTAFEIGGQIVQTTVPGDATPQAIGKATVESLDNSVVDTYDPSLVCYLPERKQPRHYVQVGFNPFTPIIQKGAEDLMKLISKDPYETGEVY